MPESFWRLDKTASNAKAQPIMIPLGFRVRRIKGSTIYDRLELGVAWHPSHQKTYKKRVTVLRLNKLAHEDRSGNNSASRERGEFTWHTKLLMTEFMALPKYVRLTDCLSLQTELAEIGSLTREQAKTDIDAVWWNGLGQTKHNPDDEPDKHWEWRAIIAAVQNKPYFRCVCIRTNDKAIQAAMIFRVDAKSVLEPEQGAVFVERLATAPRNRDAVVIHPKFRGGGTGLLAYAVALSYSMGLGGRVTLIPIAHEDFYEQFGFMATGVRIDDETLFELPTASAAEILKARGLL